MYWKFPTGRSRRVAYVPESLRAAFEIVLFPLSWLFNDENTISTAAVGTYGNP